MAGHHAAHLPCKASSILPSAVSCSLTWLRWIKEEPASSAASGQLSFFHAQQTSFRLQVICLISASSLPSSCWKHSHSKDSTSIDEGSKQVRWLGQATVPPGLDS